MNCNVLNATIAGIFAINVLIFSRHLVLSLMIADVINQKSKREILENVKLLLIAHGRLKDLYTMIFKTLMTI
jgi:hypothetical protein